MNNVLDIDSSVFDFATLDNHSQSTFNPDPRFGHIQLTMRKRMSGQIKASHAQGLALCLVDGHGKFEGWPQRKLPALELKRCVCCIRIDARNKNNFTYATTN